MEIAPQPLEPLAYHVALRDYLKTQERELWNWFASAQARAEYTENLRMELLKSTYRLDTESHPELYKGVEEAQARLGLDIPVTVYQAQNVNQSNAVLFYIPGEGHIVFSGSALSLLNAEEVKSVIGHELAHYHLWQWGNGELLITDRVIQAAAHDPRAASSHEESARLFQLYTEIFADRGSLRVTGDINPVVSGLVKLHTGIAQVSAAGYLKQAEEIFAKGEMTTEQVSHPESFMRARALKLWQEQPEAVAAQIVAMIEGHAPPDDLDLLGQVRQSQLTRRFLEYFLQPKWFQTPAVLGHARLFFPEFAPAKTKNSAGLEEFKTADAKWREYLCYVLLDFVTADPELDEVPLAAALSLCQQLELDAMFEKIAAKELKMKVRDVRKLKDQAAELLTRTEAAP